MKLKHFTICALAALTMSACDNGSSNSSHYINVPTPEGVVYADQQTDTLTVQSTDSWTATVEDEDYSKDWFSPKEFSTTVPSGKIAYSRYGFNIQANTTGGMRKSYFVIKCNGKTLRKTIVQVPWLNITKPGMEIHRKDGTVTSLYDTEHFRELQAFVYFTIAAKGGSDNLKMKLYAPSAEISTSDEWVNLQNSESAYVKSVTVNRPAKTTSYEVTIPINVTANSTSAKRQGNITITTSNGITQEVSVIQEKAAE